MSILFIDGAYKAVELAELYEASKYSKFTLGWQDTDVIERTQYPLIHSNWIPDDKRMDLVRRLIDKPVISKHLDGLVITKAVLNCSVSTDSYFIHTHIQQKVLLIYVNPVWQDGWHGETIFYEENCKEVKKTSLYTPGRCVLFDAGIPHAIRPQSILGPKYRFTLSVLFDRINA